MVDGAQSGDAPAVRPCAGASPAMVRIGRGVAAYWSMRPRPALFLDRDGIINIDRHYASRARDVALIEATAAAMRLARRCSVPVVVVSNQSGVGRGRFTWSELVAVDDEVGRLLAAAGAAADLTLYAGAAPDELGDAMLYRKPNPGMFQLAARLLPLDLPASLMVGDKPSDLLAARSAGVGWGALVDPERGAEALADISSSDSAGPAMELAHLASVEATMAAVAARLERVTSETSKGDE